MFSLYVLPWENAGTYLDEVWIVSTGLETSLNNLNKKLTRPDYPLRALDHNRISCENGRHNGRPGIMKSCSNRDVSNDAWYSTPRQMWCREQGQLQS